MKASTKFVQPLIVAAALAALPGLANAGSFTFGEFDGTADAAAFPTAPEGGLDTTTVSWVGFLLHTNAGDTPMSIYPSGTQAVVSFSPPVVIASINSLDSTNGDPVSVIGRLHGVPVWRYDSPGDHDWQKITTGAGKEVDSVTFIGKNNYYDDIEVEPAPDTDGDLFTDADEIAVGHNPEDPNDNPTMSAIADSVVQFGGTQGENDWSYGYRNYTKDGGGPNYDPATGFIPFADEAWTGSQWDLNTAAAAPWTELGPRNIHPNAGTGDIQWPIRRWVANQITSVTPLAIRWHTHHQNVSCGGNGITGALYRNGQLLDSAIIPGPDGVGVTHTYYVNASPGDRFDLALSARGTDGVDSDGCDGSENWFLVDPTIPDNPLQPDGSVFVKAGGADSDGDGLPDVWEKVYFPNDLTKLSASGDNDKDGATDLVEYQRGSDPTKADTDGDGLGDAIETNTGVFVSKTDTGSNPTKVDSDGDGLRDDAEVNGTPATNPNKSDSDADGFSDADELSWGTNPTSAQDTPTAFVIANSETDFSGVQGQKDWYNGYRVYDPTGGVVDYNPTTDFIPYPGGDGQGDWDGLNQTWTGSSWDLNTAGAAPWTYQAPLEIHPNGTNSAPTIDGIADATIEHWPIRRWVAKQLTKDTPVTLVWTVKKTNLNNEGVTGLVFVNGKLVDSKAIAGNDSAGEIRRYRTTLKPNDVVDLALSPAGPGGQREDFSDGSQDWLWIDTRAYTASDTKIAGVQFNKASNRLQFKWNSDTGAKYTVQVSDNLRDWTTLQTVDSGGAETTLSLDVPPGVAGAKFYRISR